MKECCQLQPMLHAAMFHPLQFVSKPGEKDVPGQLASFIICIHVAGRNGKGSGV